MNHKVNIRLKELQRHWWAKTCLLCRARIDFGSDFCEGCKRALPRAEHTCPRCGAPEVIFGATEATCGSCQKNPPVFRKTHALFRYTSPIDRLIQLLKYHDRLDLSRVFGRLLGDELHASGYARPDVVVPVPLHVSRLRTRGYNQSLEVARFACQQLNLPIDWEGTKRTRATAPQTDLPRDQRRSNVRGAFTASPKFTKQSVAIVDDVMTSGHTVNALAESLLHSGAKEVQVWVLARA